MTGLRRAALTFAAAGAGTAGVVGVLGGLGAVGCALALLMAAHSRHGRPAAGLGAAALLVAVRGAAPGTPPAPVLVCAALLLVVLAVACRPPRRGELDVAVLAAAGVCIVAASNATGWSPALPLTVDVPLLVAALWHRERARAGHAVRRPRAAAPPALVAGAAVLAALGLLALPTTGSTGLGTTLFGQHAAAATRSYLTPSGAATGTLSLDARGQLSRTPVLSVTAAAPLLWRGNLYATYDGHHWRVRPSTGEPGPVPVVTGTGPHPIPVAPTASDPVPPGVSVRVVAVPVGAPAGGYDGSVYTPGVLTSLTAPGRFDRRSAGGAVLEPVRGVLSAYAAQVTLPVTDPGRLAAARGPDPGGWTQLPAELPARVRTLAARITAGAHTRVAQVMAVEDYLRRHERYTLGAPVPGPRADSVDALLFGSHEGFCEQFASAAAVLLRSVHVPARLVTGYAYGSTSPASPGRRVFTDADAHAWIEVFYPGLGWSPSDPTAGIRLLAPRASWATHLRALLAAVGRSHLRRALTAAAIGLMLLAAAGAGTRARRRWRRRRSDRALGPVAAAFAALERKVPRPAAATPREYVATLPWDLHAALLAWEAEAFGAAPLGDAEVAGAVRAIRAARRTRRTRRTGRTGLSHRAGPAVAAVIATAASAPSAPPSSLLADACAGTGCVLTALATASGTVVLGPLAGSVAALPATGGNVRYEIRSGSSPAVTVRSSAGEIPTPTAGLVVSSVLVRGAPGLALYQPATGTHLLSWSEDGRRWTVSAPIDQTAADTAREVAAFVPVPPTTPTFPRHP